MMASSYLAGAIIFAQSLNLIPVWWPCDRGEGYAPSSGTESLIVLADYSGGQISDVKLLSEPIYPEYVCESKFDFYTCHSDIKARSYLEFIVCQSHIINHSRHRWGVTCGWDVHPILGGPILSKGLGPILSSYVLQCDFPDEISSGGLPAVCGDETYQRDSCTVYDEIEGSGSNVYIGSNLGLSNSLGAFSLAGSDQLAAFSLSFPRLPESIGGVAQREREPSNYKGAHGSEEAVVPINGSHGTKRMTTHDFSEEEAILIWLIGAIIGLPIVYAFGKWSGNILFKEDKE
jgi:hypothetical protein